MKKIDFKKPIFYYLYHGNTEIIKSLTTKLSKYKPTAPSLLVKTK